MSRMKRFSYAGFVGTLLGLAFLSMESAIAAQSKRPTTATHFDHPDWFKSSFLDLREDVASAAAQKKRLLLYIGQDACPYCRELMEHNFTQKSIVDYTRRHFDVLAMNMWGDAEVTDFDGKSMTEKNFAAQLKVNYTPTLLFFDEQGKTVLRVNGYFPPHQFMAALEYVAGRHEKEMSFPQFYAKKSPPAASGQLHNQPYFMKPPYDLSKRSNGKPLMVLFEQKVCSECDHLHRQILKDPESQNLIKKFDVVQLDMWSDTEIVTPSGKATTARDWARDMGLIYAPSAVFFGADNQEAIRIEALLRTFHVQSVMDYVQSGAYREQPSFQRFIEARAGKLREKGAKIELWK